MMRSVQETLLMWIVCVSIPQARTIAKIKLESNNTSVLKSERLALKETTSKFPPSFSLTEPCPQHRDSNPNPRCLSVSIRFLRQETCVFAVERLSECRK
ncbi:uncharacterized protein LY89DRAFT_361536 [Mollisia scopiformis]|uniref:Uncharacterized protein n=1 Tax=Mollisia scopiformis TaxID=149040 RepID=A0A132B5V8_MOLSC|nr:uncharacterized protein LY89DRAFT_361536 [Mollisia scopiformis]KUJ07274.1 hypothetical protein LY89DRAFT_361536 [Mollisia scopiformis]